MTFGPLIILGSKGQSKVRIDLCFVSSCNEFNAVDGPIVVNVPV